MNRNFAVVCPAGTWAAVGTLAEAVGTWADPVGAPEENIWEKKLLGFV